MNFVWHMLTRTQDENETAKLRAKVWRPPPENTQPIDPRSPWSPENEAKAFAALKMQTGAGMPALGAPPKGAVGMPQGDAANRPKRTPKLANGEAAF